MRLLLSMLDDPHAPLAALRILGRRTDHAFLRLLCHKLGAEDHSPNVAMNLARIDALPWIEQDLSWLAGLEEEQQPGAVVLVWRSRIQTRLKRRMLQYMLTNGSPLGRQWAVRALLDLLGEQGNPLLLRLLDDPCPRVQAEAVRQLKQRDIPNRMSLLIARLESPCSAVRSAAQESLEEFSFARYLSAFDTLSPEARQATGAIVLRVNPNLAEELLGELLACGRRRRLRAMQIADVLGLAPEIEFGLMELCRDEDHAVRLEAARLLGQCVSTEARRTLREMLHDSNVKVQQMAEQSLEDMASIDPRLSTLLDGGWLPLDTAETAL